MGSLPKGSRKSRLVHQSLSELELLKRSKYMLNQSEKDWTQTQMELSQQLFAHYLELEQFFACLVRSKAIIENKSMAILTKISEQLNFGYRLSEPFSGNLITARSNSRQKRKPTCGLPIAGSTGGKNKSATDDDHCCAFVFFILKSIFLLRCSERGFPLENQRH
jgi:hypothetical protein